MGGLPGVLGLGGGNNGTGQAAPGTTAANPGLTAQQQLLQQLQQQQGLANQNQVFNQEEGVANGTGPNAAQAQYKTNVQQLAGQQAGAIGSIGGISPAQKAYMIAQQGGGAMQNAAGTGAAVQAQQQQAAMNAAGGIANNQAGNQVTATDQAAKAGVAMQSNINAGNTSLANTTMQGQQGLLGGALNGAGAVLGLAHGGSVPCSFVHRMSGGGPVNAMVSPGEMYLTPGQADEVTHGQGASKVWNQATKFPGTAAVAGDSKKNDVVPASLPPGGVVIPRTVVNKGSKEAAVKFVKASLAKKGKK
jgi:hypothetical protein